MSKNGGQLDLALKGTSDLWISARHYMHSAEHMLKKSAENIEEAREEDVKNDLITVNINGKIDDLLVVLTESAAKLETRAKQLKKDLPKTGRPNRVISVANNLVATSAMSALRANYKAMIAFKDKEELSAASGVFKELKSLQTKIEKIDEIDEFMDGSSDSRANKLKDISLTPTYLQITSITRDGFLSLGEMKDELEKFTETLIRRQISEDTEQLLLQKDTRQQVINKFIETVKENFYEYNLSTLHQSIMNHFEQDTRDFMEFLTSAPRAAAEKSVETKQSGMRDEFEPIVKEALEKVYEIQLT